MPIFGIDVSHHQGGKLDWGKIRGAGIDFMLARASLATTPDEQFHRNVSRAKDAGIPVVGAYHFLYPRKIVSPVDQADLFLEQVKVPKGKLMMLDVERDSHHKPRIDDVRAFAERFAKATDGHPLLLYAPGWYWDIIGNPAASDLGRLVASRYVHVDHRKVGKRRIRIRMTPTEAFARVPKGSWKADHGGWQRATILQFTSTGKVPGHRGKIDFNAFRGTVEQLGTLTGKPPAGASPVIPVVDDQDPPDGQAAEFHTVVAGETLIGIAEQFGWERQGSMPAFRVMLTAFPENERFGANPDLILVGDVVRVG
jgi:lysozyme